MNQHAKVMNSSDFNCSINQMNHLIELNRGGQGHKRRRPTDCAQTDDAEHKRSTSSVSVSILQNRSSSMPSNNGSERHLHSSIPSICLSSSEDDPIPINIQSTNDHQITGTGKALMGDSNSSILIDNTGLQSTHRKRHQRKPIKQKPMQHLSNGLASPSSLTISIKGEPCDTDENSVTQDTSIDENSSDIGKKSRQLLTTGGSKSHEPGESSKILPNPSSTFEWLQQAFRSLMPPHTQMNHCESNRLQNITSGQSSKQKK